MQFCDKLKNLRAQSGMTQEQLAEAIYVTRAAVSKWETGKGYPGIDSLKLLSEVFNVSIDELISEDDVEAKRRTDMKKSKILYAAAAGMLLGALIFAVLVQTLGQPLYYIGTGACTLGYLALALATKNEYARAAGKASFDLKRTIARIIAIVLVAAVVLMGALELAGVI